MNNHIDEEFEDHRVEGTTIMPMFGDNMLDLAFAPEKCDPEQLPLIALRRIVMMPGMTMPISIGRSKSQRVVREAERSGQYIGLITQISDTEDPDRGDLFDVGVVCEVMKSLELPDGSHSVIMQGRRAFRLNRLLTVDPYLRAEVELLDDELVTRRSRQAKALVSILRENITSIHECPDSPVTNEIMFAINNIQDPNFLINYLSATFPMSLNSRQCLLEMRSVLSRGEELASIVSQCLEYSRIKMKMHQQTQVELSNMQRQHYLRTQIRSIQEELGETAQEDVDRLLTKANQKHLPVEVLEILQREVGKLQRINEQSPDYYVQFNYLQTMVDMPWGHKTVDNLNLKYAQRVLDRDHYGLKNVKERILEHLAVLKMRGDMKAPILCLVGPPGVGKTSLGRSIASALKRQYVRISLGGLHDEAEIRGHRRTYIGAMPGRIISGILKAKTDNPVFVLDEIDKISADFKGDPSSALLEVLDPEQNSTFHDNYLDVDYDLSKVLFIATANSLAPISGPLRDRMEIIDLSGYVLEEKVEIGERHLLPKQKEEHGLDKLHFSIPKRTMEQIIDLYTRESGVRLLEKKLAKVMRKVAWRTANSLPVPEKLQTRDLEDYLGKPDYNPERYDGNDYAGVVTGLAWTSVGGCILEVESTLVPGKGGLTLTGHLGDVMKESAQLALLWIKANAASLDIDPKIFDHWTAHIHCPEGATPKDGPSAGITMVTSLVSTFTQRRVRARIAMTGEITLRGKVIPIGGVKEKILAAKRAGITDLVLCVDNRKDVEEIEAQYTEGLVFHYVRDLHEVLDFALLPEKVKHPKTFAVTQPAVLDK